MDPSTLSTLPTQLSVFFDFYTYPVLFFLWILIAIIWRKKEKIKKKTAVLLVAAVLLFFLVQQLKIIFAKERPCEFVEGKIKCPICPPDCSLPSGHAAFSFLFVAATIGTEFFPPFLLLSILISISRVYLGVHTVYDIVGGAVLGIAMYGVVELFVYALRKEKKERTLIEIGKAEKPKEDKRQLIHILFGVLIMVLLYFVDLSILLKVSFGVFLLGLVIFDLKLKSKKIPVIDFILKKLERPGAIGHGSFWYAIGLLMLLSFLGRNEIFASLIILSISDGVATIAGIRGKTKLPYNKKKTAEGALAFFVFSLLSYFFIGLKALPLAIILTIFESLPLPLDDNLTLSVVSIVFFTL